ncbi:hypothetical protein Gorai_023114 [Gossypium raimondii]|uniref:CCHC-type domain-containing protein n=1 Tax=Gossypium raimondii TaxID=29730 RepID=A0A7J8NV66_GOSRA|nr:hypothetical protein [Gossypium raimondii]
MDIKTGSGTRDQFARMAVFIDLEKSLTSHVLINGRIQRVEFEALPVVCFSCGRYGHLKNVCPFSLTALGGLDAGPDQAKGQQHLEWAGQKAAGLEQKRDLVFGQKDAGLEQEHDLIVEPKAVGLEQPELLEQAWEAMNSMVKLFSDEMVFSTAKSGIQDGEMRASGEKADSIISKLGFQRSNCVEVIGFSGGIWIVLRDSFCVEIIKSHSQFVLVKVFGSNFKQSFFTTFVYGSPDSRKRRHP